MKTLYIDPNLPIPCKENIKEEKDIKEINTIDEAEYIFLYLHQYPSMNLRFQEFEKAILNNPEKIFIFLNWFDFKNPVHYNKVFAEYFTPEQVGMWKENVYFFQLPKTINEILPQLK